ncbi:MAG TPA: CPCC family cysteine-rich protein [Symbiobacteriaceae bacterium]|nr:CPCC family cysteine-rich protein [Symbiobacteriaceae bacterium]
MCYWEDDPVQADDPDFAGGANESSLRQAQAHSGSLARTKNGFGPTCDHQALVIAAPLHGSPLHSRPDWRIYACGVGFAVDCRHV